MTRYDDETLKDLARAQRVERKRLKTMYGSRWHGAEIDRSILESLERRGIEFTSRFERHPPRWVWPCGCAECAAEDVAEPELLEGAA